MSTRQMRRLALSAFIFLLAVVHLIPGKLLAQEAPVSTPSGTATKEEPKTAFSLQQAIEYGLQNSVNLQNAQLDVQSAKARVGEIRATGLPQISAQVGLVHNIEIQKVILENNQLSPFGDKTKPDGAVNAFPFQLKNSGAVSASFSQLLFDASYFVGLKAAAVYNQLSQKSLTQSKINTIEAVTKAYYAVLVNTERLGLLQYNVNRLDTLFRQTNAQYENGFVEKIDLDRIEVQYNNLKIDQQRTTRLVELTKHLLKFQMGYPVKDFIELTDKLSLQNVENLALESSNPFIYTSRIEYSILESQKELASLDIRNIRAGYYPQLSAGATFGYNPAATQFSNLFNRDRWFQYSLVSVQLQIPIFDGFRKRYKTQQAKITLDKTNRSMRLLENSIDLDIQQASINLANSVDALKTQRRNLELAQQVAKVTKIKYEQGVGSNIELTSAEASLREAQTNYYSALYDSMVAKVDADKASGKLYTE